MTIFKSTVADPAPPSVVVVNAFVDQPTISESIVYIEFRISPSDADALIQKLQLGYATTPFAQTGNVPPPDPRIPWFDPTQLGANATVNTSKLRSNLTVWLSSRRDHAFAVELNF